MATVIKVKEDTKKKLKEFAIKKFGKEVGNEITFDTIIITLLKGAIK